MPLSGRKTESAYGMSHFFIKSATKLTANLNVSRFFVSVKFTLTLSFLSLSWSYSLERSYDLSELSTPAFFMDEKSCCFSSFSSVAPALAD